VIYLYAITESGGEAPDCPGLGDAPLGLLHAGEVAGLYSRHEAGDFAPEPDALWRHDQVVEAAMSRGAVLPARFGTTFTDTSALATALERGQAALRRQLERVRGCVELAVRVSLPPLAPHAPADGRNYLHVKLARQHERQAVAERTLVPLAAHAVRSHRPTNPAETSTLTASYLVRAGEVDRFAERVRILARRHSELSLSCTGPWPPYSFVGEEGP
jgi:hypothetical protein